MYYYMIINFCYFLYSVKCLEGRCEGFNERKNAFNAGRHFANVLLSAGAPESLKHRLEVVKAAFLHAAWHADQLLQHLETIVHDYVSGNYLMRQPGDDATSELITDLQY